MNISDKRKEVENRRIQTQLNRILRNKTTEEINEIKSLINEQIDAVSNAEKPNVG